MFSGFRSRVINVRHFFEKNTVIAQGSVFITENVLADVVREGWHKRLFSLSLILELKRGRVILVRFVGPNRRVE